MQKEPVSSDPQEKENRTVLTVVAAPTVTKRGRMLPHNVAIIAEEEYHAADISEQIGWVGSAIMALSLIYGQLYSKSYMEKEEHEKSLEEHIDSWSEDIGKDVAELIRKGSEFYIAKKDVEVMKLIASGFRREQES